MWGFSFLETDASKRTYLEQAKSKKLWLDPTWIRLGHYEKKIFGNYESSFRGFLFIDPDGYRSPEKEMTATLKAFFSPSPDLTAKFTRHPQCQFLARRRFLAEKLHISTEHLEVLAEWSVKYGRKWKSILLFAWESGNYEGFEKANYLQQIRNIYGPSWLIKFNFKNHV